MDTEIEERNIIARRAAKEIEPGMVVNLGIGIPELVAHFIPRDWQIMFHSVNGILGIGSTPIKGHEDPYLFNAGGTPVTLVPGASIFDTTMAYAMVRRRMLDIAILGGHQVDVTGNLANWIIPGERVHGIGGGMELAQRAKKVIVLMKHLDPQGKSKIVKRCTYPLTAKACVHLIITERAVIEVTQAGLLLREVQYPYTLLDVLGSTDAPLRISENLLVAE
ncbi:CoA-transferase subunit beta [Brevibacillus ginsengisoli]|uniref:CoA-transferase subunit beta n=1 Tax=Brevibacillus ginsengisoli TaxID=363854 RepID=UPI003CF809DB